jgi:hypothetical protein
MDEWQFAPSCVAHLVTADCFLMMNESLESQKKKKDTYACVRALLRSGEEAHGAYVVRSIDVFVA